MSAVTTDRPECPGPDCLACNGEACDVCGTHPDPPCEHDVIERHGFVYLGSWRACACFGPTTDPWDNQYPIEPKCPWCVLATALGVSE